MRFHRVILEMLLSLFYQLQILVSSQNPSSARIPIHSPSNVLSIHFTTQDTVNSFLDHQQNKWLRHGVIHSSHNTNPVASLGLRIHRRRLKQKFHKAQARVWAESTTCFQEFCVSEHLPDQVFSKQRHIMRFKFRATT